MENYGALAPLDSLSHLTPSFYSLKYPHPIWTTAASHPYECSKSTTLAVMMSGRYRTDYLCRHWSQDNISGFCRAATCSQVLGTLEHLLISCPFHDPTRTSLKQMLIDRSAELPELHAFVQQVLASPPPIKLQFILEPQAFPQIRNLFNCLGQPAIDLTCYLVRTYAFYIHRQRQICLGRWPGHTTTQL